MKLYLTAAGVYAGTQAEAKADGKGWKPEEVPVSKYPLIDYLNKLKHSTTVNVTNPMEGEPGALVEYFRGDGFQPYGHTGDYEGWQPEETAIHFLRKLKPFASKSDVERTISATPVALDELTHIEDFILNRASVAQIEQLFARLGTRYAEGVLTASRS